MVLGVCCLAVSIAYATESTRLTTRLLDLASWLLIQRSLKEGEITLDEALAAFRFHLEGFGDRQGFGGPTLLRSGPHGTGTTDFCSASGWGTGGLAPPTRLGGRGHVQGFCEGGRDTDCRSV